LSSVCNTNSIPLRITFDLDAIRRLQKASNRRATAGSIFNVIEIIFWLDGTP
jgi:hypothetical protein